MEKRKSAGRSAESLDKRPELFDDLNYIVDAFWQLNQKRQAGEQESPIPGTEIIAWLDLHRIDDQECREDFYDLISDLDSAYIEYQRKNQKQKAGGA